MGSVVDKWKQGLGFLGTGFTYVVLPNLNDPNGGKSQWQHLPHMLDHHICEFCRNVSGAVGMVGLSRGAMHVLWWKLNYPSYFFPNSGDRVKRKGWVLSCAGYHWENANRVSNEQFASALIRSQVPTAIMYSTEDQLCRHDQCPGYYDVLGKYITEKTGEDPHHEILTIWVGHEKRFGHAWFNFFISGLSAPNDVDADLRRFTYAKLSGREGLVFS